MLEINKNRNRFWFNDKNQLHRKDGPAIEYINGTKKWYLNDKLHREDGPAIEYSGGARCWLLNGKEYSEEEYKMKVRKLC